MFDNFKFNGTSSFRDLFDSLGIVDTQAKVKDDSVVFNVAGFKKEEISVEYDNGVLSIVCKGNSPFFGSSYSIIYDMENEPVIRYQDGCVIADFKPVKPKKVKLEFSEDTLLD